MFRLTGTLRELTEQRFRSARLLMAPDTFVASLRRESARADRGGRPFALVLVRLPNARPTSASAHRILRTLIARARVTDEVGRFSERYLGVILPDTDVAGGQRFADDVGRLLGRRGPRPLCVVYAYPWSAQDEADWTRIGISEMDLFGRRASATKRRDQDPSDPYDPNGGAGHDNNNAHPGGKGNGNGNGNGNGRASENGNGHGNAHARLEAAALRLSTGAVGLLEPLAPREGLSGRLQWAWDGWEPGLMEYVLDEAAEELPGASIPPPLTSLPMEMFLVQPIPAWKRLMDLLGATMGLALFSPLLVGVAIAVKLSSRGPLIFKQQRAGLGGRPFTMYKFRTMVADAEAQLEKLKAANEQDGAAFKMRHDPRVTPVGRFLRKMSLDELPQLVNVLKGDMTLVGPRPLPSQQSALCAQWQRRRLDVTPGLTCIWQVRGRSQVKFDDWVRMDMTYIRKRTFWQDLKILLQTTPAVLKGKGAY